MGKTIQITRLNKMLLPELSDCYGSRKENARAVVIKQSKCCNRKSTTIDFRVEGHINIWREKNIYFEFVGGKMAEGYIFVEIRRYSPVSMTI